MHETTVSAFDQSVFDIADLYEQNDAVKCQWAQMTANRSKLSS